MTKDIFVSKLKALQPTVETLKTFGLSDIYVEKYLTSYICTPKYNTAESVIFSNNEILRLISEFDCSSVRISTFSFLSYAKENLDFYMIGSMEQDPVIINKVTFEIEVRDIHNMKDILWYCASNSSNFLDALLICVEYYSRRIQNRKLLDNVEFKKEFLSNATEQAGGDKYEEFYKVILGFYS